MSQPEHPAQDPAHLLVELSLDQCIKCNICVTKCPVAAVTDLFPGPKYAGPQAGRFRQAGQPVADASVDYCSGCRVCNLACPTGVKIAEINARARARMVASGKVDLRLRLRNNLIARSELVGRLGHPLAPLANFAFSNRLLRRLMDTILKIHPDAPLPALSRERFSTWFHRHVPPAGSTRQVAYFHGCSTEYYEPRLGRAAVRVLEANGFAVVIPRQNCCGLPLLSNGEFPAARRYHESNVRGLAPLAQQGIPIVGASTSCTLTLKEEAPELLDMHDPDTRLVATYTYDLNEFLLSLLDSGTLKIDFQPLPITLAYHQPCQYRAHRLGSPAVELLALIPGLRLVESQALCCGIAGTYGFKSEKYDIAQAVGAPLFSFIRSVDSLVVVCDSETCRWQITQATGVPAVHPVELLAVAYGFPPEGPLSDLFKGSKSIGNKA
jgi:glycerol-3-phosphate dehydrogenase subunit C